MKKKNTILLLGISSIAILIIAQVIIIRGVWKQNDEMLDLRYRSSFTGSCCNNPWSAFS